MMDTTLPCRKQYDNSICYQDDSREAEKSAIEEFLKMKATGEYPNIRFVMSNHWASEGWWIEWGQVLPKLGSQDNVVAIPDPNNLMTAK